MNTIFTIDDPENFADKINLDQLYERNQSHALAATHNYNIILNRIHNKIKATSRTQLTEQFCWFLVPEMMIGVPKYDQTTCIAYVIDKLQKNGLKIRYTHPNLLFISWTHWVPGYVRTEIKKKTGVSIDGYGNILNTSDKTDINDTNDINQNNLLLNNNNNSNTNNNNSNTNNNYYNNNNNPNQNNNNQNQNNNNPNQNNNNPNQNNNNNPNQNNNNPNQNNNNNPNQNNNNKYKSISSYKPIGNLIYNNDLITSLKEKLHT